MESFPGDEKQPMQRPGDESRPGGPGVEVVTGMWRKTWLERRLGWGPASLQCSEAGQSPEGCGQAQNRQVLESHRGWLDFGCSIVTAGEQGPGGGQTWGREAGSRVGWQYTREGMAADQREEGEIKEAQVPGFGACWKIENKEVW